MGVMGGSEDIQLSTVRSCGIEVPLNKALDMNRSLYITISYLLKDESGEFGV